MPPVHLLDRTRPHGGLWTNGPRDAIPAGALRRARGLHAVRRNSLASRPGSTLLYALNAHSLFRYNDVRFQGASAILYRNGISIKAGLNGNPLSFVRALPPSGIADYLFCSGGGSLFKASTAGAVTNWGIVAPPDGFTAAKATGLAKVIDNCDSRATWTGVNVTLADEATIKQEGTKSMKMTVAASTTATVTKAITLDLTAFTAGGASVLEDFITSWFRVDHPENILSLSIAFDVVGTGFASDVYSRTLSAMPSVIGQIGLAAAASEPTLETIVHECGDGATWLETIPVSPPAVAAVLEATSVAALDATPNTWTQIRVPKAAFDRSGTSANDWSDVLAVRLAITTNAIGGIVAYIDDIKLSGGAGMIGKYRYRVTYKNSTTGSRSNGNPTEVTIEKISREGVDLAALPTSADAQVDKVEVWRSVGDGAYLFKCGEVANGIVTFTDRVSDYAGLNSSSGATILEPLTLSEDNDPPGATYAVCFGPYDGRVFWTADPTAGARGRVYYSPSGRPEAVEGFVDVTMDDDPTLVGVIWNNSPWVFTQTKVVQIVVSDIVTYRTMDGVPSTTAACTVVSTPYGIIYQAADGIRLFNGVTSVLIGFSQLGLLFRGEDADGGYLTAFEGIVATFRNNEYIVSDGDQTLALNCATDTWRDLGIGCSAFYAEDEGALIATISGNVYSLEVEGTVLDGSVAVPFSIETGGALLHPVDIAIVKRLFIEADTGSVLLTPTLVLDNAEIALPPFQTTARAITEYAIGRTGRVLGVRLDGSLTAAVEIFGVDADVHNGASP